MVRSVLPQPLRHPEPVSELVRPAGLAGRLPDAVQQLHAWRVLQSQTGAPVQHLLLYCVYLVEGEVGVEPQLGPGVGQVHRVRLAHHVPIGSKVSVPHRAHLSAQCSAGQSSAQARRGIGGGFVIFH